MQTIFTLRFREILCALLFPVLLCIPAQADDNWERLGQETVRSGSDEAKIRVGMEEGWYRWIKLEAEGGKIDLRKVKVVFSDGEKEDFEIYGTLSDGEETRSLMVSGAVKRFIRRVEIKYDMKSDSDPVKVKVFGRRSD